MKKNENSKRNIRQEIIDALNSISLDQIKAVYSHFLYKLLAELRSLIHIILSEALTDDMEHNLIHITFYYNQWTNESQTDGYLTISMPDDYWPILKKKIAEINTAINGELSINYIKTNQVENLTQATIKFADLFKLNEYIAKHYPHVAQTSHLYIRNKKDSKKYVIKLAKLDTITNLAAQDLEVEEFLQNKPEFNFSLEVEDDDVATGDETNLPPAQLRLFTIPTPVHHNNNVTPQTNVDSQSASRSNKKRKQVEEDSNDREVNNKTEKEERQKNEKKARKRRDEEAGEKGRNTNKDEESESDDDDQSLSSNVRPQ